VSTRLPLHFDALLADPATPLSERAAYLLHVDLQRWTRRYVRPLARITSLATVWLIVTVKRLLPFQFSSHDRLDRLSVWFLRRCVSPEGGELLLRHFMVETSLLRFLVRNGCHAGGAEPQLLPATFAALMGHAVIQHDMNMYRAIIDVGRELRSRGRFRFDTLASPDFSMLELPDIEPDRQYRRIINLDLGSALYFMNILFALLTTEDIYEQAVNSFQLDESLLAHLADMTGDPAFRAWGAYRSLSWLAIDRDVPRELYLHAVVHEYAHTQLCRLSRFTQRNSAGHP
jgi:hypothetical protein